MKNGILTGFLFALCCAQGLSTQAAGLQRRWTFDGTPAEAHGGCPMHFTAPPAFAADGARSVLALGGNAGSTNDDPA